MFVFVWFGWMDVGGWILVFVVICVGAQFGVWLGLRFSAAVVLVWCAGCVCFGVGCLDQYFGL